MQIEPFIKSGLDTSAMFLFSIPAYWSTIFQKHANILSYGTRKVEFYEQVVSQDGQLFWPIKNRYLINRGRLKNRCD